MVIDKNNVKGILENFSSLCKESLGLNQGIAAPSTTSNVVVLGVGAGGIAGDLLTQYVHESPLPVSVVRDYRLPGHVGKDTLVFALSYSGDDEEVLSCYDQAKSLGATVIAITSGGQLSRVSERTITVPEGLPARMSLPCLFFPMLGVLYNGQFIDVKNADLTELITLLRNTSYYDNEGHGIARKIGDKFPLIIASEQLRPIANRFCQSIQQFAKHPAACYIVPDMTHTAINQFKTMERGKYIAFFLRDEHEHPSIRKHMDATRALVEERVECEEIFSQGESFLARLFSLLYLGEYTSYYLALANRCDPSELPGTDRIKDLL